MKMWCHQHILFYVSNTDCRFLKRRSDPWFCHLHSFTNVYYPHHKCEGPLGSAECGSADSVDSWVAWFFFLSSYQIYLCVCEMLFLTRILSVFSVHFLFRNILLWSHSQVAWSCSVNGPVDLWLFKFGWINLSPLRLYPPIITWFHIFPYSHLAM